MKINEVDTRQKVNKEYLMNNAKQRIDGSEEHDIKCLYTNTDCLRNKLEEIEVFCNENKIDIVAITETQLKNRDSDDNFILPGFVPFQSDKGRGVALFIREYLESPLRMIM